MDTAVAVLAALLSAVCFGVASVVQQQVASEAPAEESLRLRLLLNLARRPAWLAGMALTVLSYAMQGLALAFGPLVLVQPLAATDLVFALPLLAWHRRVRLTRVECAGIVCTAGGVAAFLAVLPTTSTGTAVPALRDWLPLLAAVGGAVALLASAGLKRRGRARTGLYAISAALLFALLDSLTKSAADQFRADGLGTLSRWEPYALIVVGIAALVLSQSSFQAGSLAISLPIIDTLEPIGGVLIGVAVFNEQLASSTLAVTVQALGAAVAVVGIVLLDLSPLARS
jgi:drug/metabolite transporter (DMT)-like permease